jgi:heme-degrading monooxygenase HmoA
MTSVKHKQSSTPKSASRSSKPSRKEWEFLVIWEFLVREGMEKRFERIYGAHGDWVQLFARDSGYIRTELVHESNSASYLTLDFWTSETAYDAFRKQHRAEYKTIDLKCEGITKTEREIGRFVRVSTE